MITVAEKLVKPKNNLPADQLHWPFIFVVWVLIGLLFSLQVYLQRAYENQPVTFAQAIERGLLFWVLWGLLTPVILWMARNFRITRQYSYDSFLFHVPVGIIFSLLHLLLYAMVLEWALETNPIYTFAIAVERFRLLFLSSFTWASTIYWTILIGSHAFDFYQRYQNEVVKASRLEAQLAQAQLQALKMQLQPHFLFNTLHSISALLREDVEAADKMIARLGDFLRLTLDNAGSQSVTLQRELEFLRCYLDIEAVRFQDRLTTQLAINPTILNAQVPNLILQPLVENAIRHGIANNEGDGCIEIRAGQQDSWLQIEVRDNGPGLLSDNINEGIGLANTRARLQQLYGAQHRFELSNAPEGGLRVILAIPLENKKGLL